MLGLDLTFGIHLLVRLLRSPVGFLFTTLDEVQLLLTEVILKEDLIVVTAIIV